MNRYQRERRFWLKNAALAAGAGATSTLAGLSAVDAMAQDSPDYRALVCVFLYGGNDSLNMFVPRSDDQYELYASARRNLAVSKESLIGVSPTASDGSQYGFHPSVPEMASLFNNGKLAVVGNVGPLIVPTTRDDYQANRVALPPRLFSHNDQQNFWQSLQSAAPQPSGWAGRVADAMQAQYVSGELSMNISMAGSNLMQTGASSIPYNLSPSGVVHPKMNSLLTGYGRLERRQKAIDALIGNDTGSLLANHYRETMRRSIVVGDSLGEVLDNSVSIETGFPVSDLGAAMKMVARMIANRNTLGLRRQIFFVGFGGWDTHGDQNARHPALLRTLSESLGAFYNATESLGVASQVTTFTAADFGRTLTTNGDGTDHGWGGHQIVLGGAVKGNTIYGQMPEIRIEGPQDSGRGRLIPTTSVDQYAATLAQWYGLPAGNMADVFPNLGNFDKRTLAFL